MKKLRSQIDKIDSQILTLLKKRVEIARQIAKFKKKKKLPIYDRKREGEIFESLTHAASEKGLDPAFAKKFYRLLLQYSRREMRRCI